MIVITIGRDATKSQLKLSVGQQSKCLGAEGSVPQTVSRQHCTLTINDNGTYVLKNLKVQNVTYVNGQQIDTKTIQENDTIELGPDKYLVDWSFLKTVMPAKVETVDIRSLERVWEWYDSTQLDLKESERKTQNYQKLGGILSTCGILFMFVDGFGSMRYVLMGISVLIAIYFFIRGFSSSSSLNVKLNDLSKEFRSKYKCPKCGHFMGNIPYDVLIQGDACPYCKRKYKK